MRCAHPPVVRGEEATQCVVYVVVRAVVNHIARRVIRIRRELIVRPRAAGAEAVATPSSGGLAGHIAPDIGSGLQTRARPPSEERPAARLTLADADSPNKAIVLYPQQCGCPDGMPRTAYQPQRVVRDSVL